MNTISSTMELIGLLNSINGATIVGLTSETKVSMRKTGNPLANFFVTKLSEKTVQFGYCYENAVNNRLDKIGVDTEFQAQPLRWGEWLIPNKVITHKGKFYGRFYSIANAKPTNIYFVNGRVANPKELEIIKAFENGHDSESKTQANAGLVENQVTPMNFEFSSIKSMRVNGQVYEIKFSPSPCTIGA